MNEEYISDEKTEELEKLEEIDKSDESEPSPFDSDGADPVEHFYPRQSFLFAKILFIVFWISIAVFALLCLAENYSAAAVLRFIAVIALVGVFTNGVLTTYQYYNKKVEQNDRIIELLEKLDEKNKK